jgi:hypothetical protein
LEAAQPPTPHPALRKQAVLLGSSETDIFTTTYSIPTVESGLFH